MMVQLTIGTSVGRTDIYNLLQQQQSRNGGNNSVVNCNGVYTANKEVGDSSCLSVDDRLASVSSARILNETIRVCSFLTTFLFRMELQAQFV